MSVDVEISSAPMFKSTTVFSLIRGDIACVFNRDPAARSTIEVITTYPGVQATALYRVAHYLWSGGWRYLPRVLSYLGRIWTGIDIHPAAQIGSRFFIDHGSGVVIGETAQIGDDVTLYHGVTLGGVSWCKGKRHPTLGDGVVVGAGAKILGPIEIGNYAKIGANSVVIHPVADRKTVVGIPAKAVDSAAWNSNASGGIDLNHHLIPDPVAEAISCLLERIRLLEDRMAVPDDASGDKGRDDDCMLCDAAQVCEPVPVKPRHAAHT
ncbi:MAG: serine O-acetyltransferase [Gammaproteobacteria bacterium]|nr:serine O-acetyltransferase [Gammaproteobacteria bacterium]